MDYICRLIDTPGFYQANIRLLYYKMNTNDSDQ